MSIEFIKKMCVNLGNFCCNIKNEVVIILTLLSSPLYFDNINGIKMNGTKKKEGL